jgi:hypothetical protein
MAQETQVAVEKWDAKGSTYETLAIRSLLALARAVFAVASRRRLAGS